MKTPGVRWDEKLWEGMERIERRKDKEREVLK
jgi:hypothetical protein